jgi:hypothetical protein
MTFPVWAVYLLYAGGIGSAAALIYLTIIKPIADWGASKEREAGLIDDNKELDHENARLNNRPRTNADRHNRLRAWIGKLPKSDR